MTPELARAVHAYPRAHARRAAGRAARGRARRARAGEPAGHDRPSSPTGGASSRSRSSAGRRGSTRCRRARASAAPRCAPRATRRAERASAPRATARIPRATYRLQLHRDFTFADATRARAVPRAAGHQPRLLLAVSCARGRAARTATTSSTTTRSTRRSADARGLRRASSTTLRAHGMGHAARPGAEPHGRAGRRQRVVAGRARERAGRRATPTSSTSTGSRSTATLDGKVLLPVLGDHYGDVLERGELALAFDAGAGAFARRATTSTASRSTRASIRACSSARCACATAADATAQRELASVCRAHSRRLPARDDARRRRACRAPPRQGRCTSAHLAALVRRARRRSRAAIERAVSWLNGTPGERELRRAARAARGAGLPARVLARRRRRDQLPPLLRHQRPGGAAHGGRARVRGDARAGARAGRGRQGRRAAHRPSRRPVRSRRSIPAPAASATRTASASPPRRPRRPAGAAALRRGGEDRRRRTSACPRAGRSTAPPATASPTS